MRRILLALCLASSLGSFLGCFSVGLPEYFSEATTTSSASGRFSRSVTFPSRNVIHKDHQRALIITPTLDRENQTLGHQYLFGIFPITNLFLQHSVGTLLEEETLDIFQQLGYAVYSSDKRSASQAVEILNPEVIIEPLANTIHINAFDLFFFRILKASVKLQINYLKKNGSALLVEKSLPVENEIRRYRSFGHAPALSLLLHTAVRNALESSLTDLPKKLRTLNGRSSYLEGEERPLLIISPPFFNVAPPSELGETLAKSYGFGVPPFSEDRLRRLVQRGFRLGLTAMNAEVVTVNNLDQRNSSIASKVWFIKSVVESITAKDNKIGMTVLFQIQEPDKELLRSVRCSGEQTVTPTRDGRWVVALENSAAALIEQAFEVEHSSNQSEQNQNNRCTLTTTQPTNESQ